MIIFLVMSISTRGSDSFLSLFFFAQRDHIMSITTLTEEVHLLTKYINMVLIRVINRNTGNPVSYANVSIHFNSLTRLGRSTGRTDSSGVASINTDPAYDGEVYINGKRVHKGRVTADMSFSV